MRYPPVTQQSWAREEADLVQRGRQEPDAGSGDSALGLCLVPPSCPCQMCVMCVVCAYRCGLCVCDVLMYVRKVCVVCVPAHVCGMHGMCRCVCTMYGCGCVHCVCLYSMCDVRGVYGVVCICLCGGVWCACVWCMRVEVSSCIIPTPAIL